MVNREDLLDKFVKSMGDLLNDMTALEVNTMIVAQITGAKFNAWEAYHTVFSVSELYIKDTKICPKLYERYTSLLEKLEKEYFNILIDKNSGLDDLNDELIERYNKRIAYIKAKKTLEAVRPVLPDPNLPNSGKEAKALEAIRPILPDPNSPDPETGKIDWLKIQKILDNGQFLRSLRKIIELKAALDSNNLETDRTDIIYAQTVMQLDGDIINRYNERLFDKNDVRDLILKTHNDAVISGEKQWRELLDFIVDLTNLVRPRKLF